LIGRPEDALGVAWRLPGPCEARTLPRQSFSTVGPRIRRKWLTSLLDLGTEEVTTAETGRSMARWTAARYTTSVSERSGRDGASPSELAATRRGPRPARQRARSSRLTEPEGRSSQASFLGAWVKTRSAEERHQQRGAKTILGRGPAPPTRTSKAKASGTIAMTQGAGPNAGPPAAQRCSVGRPRRGQRAGRSQTQRRTFRRHGDGAEADR